MSAEKPGDRLAPAQDRLAVRFQLQYADGEAFVRGYAGNVSAAGMFIAAEEPPPPGTRLYFAVHLGDESCVLCGEGEVVWVAVKSPLARPTDGAGSTAETQVPAALHGFGLRFIRLDPRSVQVLRQMLAYRAAHPELFFTAPADPYAVHSAAPWGMAIAPSPAPVQPPAAPSSESRQPAHRAAVSPAPADEEAELKSLLLPPLLAPPSAGDAARLLDDLLRRRPC